MNKRNLLIAIAVIIFGGILVVLFLVSKNPAPKTPVPETPKLSKNKFPLPQSNDQTPYPDAVGSDWETYSNTRFNYSMKYPPGWATIINVTPNSSKENLTNATSLDIFDSAAKKGYPEGVMTIQYLKTPLPIPTNWSKTEVNLAGKNVQKFEGDDKDLHMESYIIPVAGNLLEIDTRYTPGDSIKKTFDAMLSTLQL